ncbi:MAG: transcriptional antiterminator RfaH [Verrucomicrobiota bacterium]|nr:transcriptional antiterminator RfaH [Verrucomicrobiota bacterium]MDK2964263.1 transcriptional antiterminator RfaH [Verrucomicrobiota bacterium]
MNKTDDIQIPWRCIRTQAKREHIAAGQLRRLAGVEVFAPRIRFQRRMPRGRVWFEESLFPGYIFARFDAVELLRAVSAAIGVRGLVRFGGEYAAVPVSAIDFLRSEVDGTLVIPGPELKAGDETIVATGALRGLHAVVSQVLPGGERVKILMELMGTMVKIEVPAESLEPIT